MNRLDDRLNNNLNPGVLDAIKRFAETYRLGSPTQKHKDQIDYHAYNFIESMTDDETEIFLYKRRYMTLTGRKPDKKHDTTVFLAPVN